MLAVAAIVLVLIFNADVTKLIQLYVVGVFVSFTLSQTGMIRHWTRHLKNETDPTKRPAMQRSRIINGIGVVCTAAVLIIVLISKFTHGAWAALLAMAILFGVMKLIKLHYVTVARETAWRPPGDDRVLPSRVHAVVVVSKVTHPVVQAIMYAKASRPSTLEAITVEVDAEETQKLLLHWKSADLGLPLRVIASPVPRSDRTDREIRDHDPAQQPPRDVVCVYIPEIVVGHWWEQPPLHNQTGLLLRTRLHFAKGVMVTSVPYLLRSASVAKDRIARENPLAFRGIGTTQMQSDSQAIRRP